MDLIIVPSEHSKSGFVNTIYDKLNNLPDGKQQKIGELKLEKPMEVLFEGVDENIYKSLEMKEIDKEFFDWLNNEVPEKFAFLHVGQWTKGDYGEDRKDISKTIKIFYESFANKKKQPALILKTNGATYSVLDREDCKTKIDAIKNQFPKDWKLPNVYLLHGELNKQEMNYLYNHPKIKSFVSFTHGEGFGRPLLEATMVGLPVIASGWSGHLDFLSDEYSLVIKGTLNKIPKSAVWKDLLIPESQWFSIDESDAYKAFNYTFKEHQLLKRNANILMTENYSKFTLSNMTGELKQIIDKYISAAPSAVSFNLPKLKKVKDDKNSKLTLPKLKKV